VSARRQSGDSVLIASASPPTLQAGLVSESEKKHETRGPPPALDYARRLYADTLGWYRSAETKAQVILTFDGILLAAFTGLTLTKRVDVLAVFEVFGHETWGFLIAGGASLVVSIGSAVACLASRTYKRGDVRHLYRELRLDPADAATYKPEALWFFQHIEGLDRRHFESAIAAVDEHDEIRILASQVHVLSGNVRKKHAWVNRAFLFAGLTLVLLLVTAADYVIRAT
jgi:pycsar effector protein